MPSLEVLQVGLHGLVQQLARSLYGVDVAAFPLWPGTIGELTQVKRTQLGSNGLGHGIAISLGQQLTSQPLGFGQQLRMGSQEFSEDAVSLDR